MTEFARPLRLDAIGSGPTARRIEASTEECAKLARRFDLVALASLTADLVAQRIAGGVALTGQVEAHGTQPCVVSGLPVAFTIAEPLALRFERAADTAPDEVELSDADLDVLPLDGDHIDLGEAAAQALGLALDPYPRASEAELAEYRSLVLSEEDAARAASPFAVLGSG